jgi:hypothetical protein
MDTVTQNSSYPVTFRGVRSCEIGDSDILVRSTDNNYSSNPESDCVSRLEGQYEVISKRQHPADGDSGAVPYVKNDGKYYAIGSLAAGTCRSTDNIYRGPQGYTIRNRHNIWWDNL